ncbi:MAG: lipid-A-disaccharide synthase [Candidatus Margulisiibacteriota bacterium]
MVSAGEVSGDVHGSYLVKELKKLRPDLAFFGLGSERLAEAGVDIRFDIIKRGSIGILEALPNVFPLFSIFRKVKKLVLAEKPDLVILIDSQGINLPLAKFCKAVGIKTVYYIAPQEWLWGTPRGVKHVAQIVDLIVAIFPREYEAYKAAGANVIYEGHPLIDIVQAPQPLSPRSPSPRISLCPGSRMQEIGGLLPILLKAGELIKKELPDAEFLIPVSSRNLFQEIFALVGDFRPMAVFGKTYETLASSNLAICTSGTINFEASLLGVPNIMTYKLSRLTYWAGKYILKIDRKIKYFCMPNILMDNLVIPELVMENATAEKIAQEALAILRDTQRQEKMKKEFVKLKGELGRPGMIGRIAKSILA